MHNNKNRKTSTYQSSQWSKWEQHQRSQYFLFWFTRPADRHSTTSNKWHSSLLVNISDGDRPKQIHVIGATGASPVSRSKTEHPTRMYIDFTEESIEEARTLLAKKWVKCWEYGVLVGQASLQIFFENPCDNMIEPQEDWCAIWMLENASCKGFNFDNPNTYIMVNLKAWLISWSVIFNQYNQGSLDRRLRCRLTKVS